MRLSLLFSSLPPTWSCAAVGPSSLLDLAFLHGGPSAHKWQETPFQPSLQPGGKDSQLKKRGSCWVETPRPRRAHTSQASPAGYCCLFTFHQTAALSYRLSTERMDLRMDVFNVKPWFRCPLRYTPVLLFLFGWPSISFFIPWEHWIFYVEVPGIVTPSTRKTSTYFCENILI